MPIAPRQMRLTAEHVRRVHRVIADPGPRMMPEFRPATEDDYNADVADILARRPPGPFWLFAYGSLIWKPESEYADQRVVLARGWHRRFCLGWDYRYRGNVDEPGLMMALDRGGQCKGMAYRLPEETLVPALHKLMRREVSMVPSAFPYRFIDVTSEAGPLRVLTFAMNRKSTRYVANLSDEQLADVLAKACGYLGSMAEYLFSTVSKLEELGIHDRNLWRLQALVADRIDAAHPTES